MDYLLQTDANPIATLFQGVSESSALRAAQGPTSLGRGNLVRGMQPGQEQRDRVTVSPEARNLTEVQHETSAVSLARLDFLRQAIQEDKLTLSPQAIAQAIAREENFEPTVPRGKLPQPSLVDIE